jgi:hypothetical protein
LSALDNVYDDDADDKLMELGVQLGKLRISERIGGWIRLKLVQELNGTLHDVVVENTRTTGKHKSHEDARAPLYAKQTKSYIGPGPEYIPPAPRLFFPGAFTNTSLLDYLPLKQESDLLTSRYANAVHPVARAVHWPTFEAQYSVFWASVASSVEPIPSIQAIVFAALFSAAVSLNEAAITENFGTTKATLVDSLRTGTEMVLSKANFVRTTRLDTMQAFVMYLPSSAFGSVSSPLRACWHSHPFSRMHWSA